MIFELSKKIKSKPNIIPLFFVLKVLYNFMKQLNYFKSFNQQFAYAELLFNQFENIA